MSPYNLRNNIAPLSEETLSADIIPPSCNLMHSPVLTHSRLESVSSLLSESSSNPLPRETETTTHLLEQQMKILLEKDKATQTTLAETQTTLTALLKAIQKLGDNQNHGNGGVTNTPVLPNTTTHASGSVTSQEKSLNLPLPPPFTGEDRQLTQPFIDSLELVFEGGYDTYTSDRRKIVTFRSLLTKSAAIWQNNLVEKPVEWEEFKKLFLKAFTDHDAIHRAFTDIWTIRQGNRRVTDYATSFQQIAGHLVSMDVDTKMRLFRQGLSEELQVQLSYNTRKFDSLSDVIDAATFLDNIMANNAYRHRTRPSDVNHSRKFGQPKQQTQFSQVNQPANLANANRQRGPLSDQEKARRRELQLCWYCASPDHGKQDCRLLARRIASVNVNSPPVVIQNQDFPCPPPFVQTINDVEFYDGPVCLSASAIYEDSHAKDIKMGEQLHIPFQLRIGNTKLDARAFLDCGADRCYMDAKFASHLQIPLIPLEFPLPVQLADGTATAMFIKHRTAPLGLIIGEHYETRTFLITQLCRNVMFGCDWLKHHNPTIDWDKPSITFRSPYCLANCCSIPQEAPALYISSVGDIEYPPGHIASIQIDFVKEFPEVFEEREFDDPLPHREADCPIDVLENTMPIHYKSYRFTDAQKRELDEYIAKSLEKGHIRPSKSPWAFPIFFQKNKKGKKRPCVNYRGLNNVTIKDRYPLPNIDYIVEEMRLGRVFTKLDLHGAYNLLRMKKGDEYKTAFSTPSGHWEYLVMPFGLANGPAVFQRFMDNIFRDILGKYVFVYLDDIIIFSTSPQDHIIHVREVLQRLQDNRLTCGLHKCVFAQSKLDDFLGYSVSGDGVAMQIDKCQQIKDWPIPESAHDVQILLGFANFYRSFIPKFADICMPLTSLLSKGTEFTWGPDQHQALESLKNMITSDIVKPHPEPSKRFFLETDASLYALSGILSQEDDVGNIRPVSFYAKKLTPAQRNYDIGDRELLAIVESCKHWRHHLAGARHPIRVITDHANLVKFTTTKTLNSRQERWSIILADYDLEIIHRAGELNGAADALSRRPDLIPADFALDMDRPILRLAEINITDLPRQLQASYEVIENLTEVVKKYRLKQRDGLWMTEDDRIFIPTDSLRLEILALRHDHPMAGHYGITKTISLVKRDFWWPGFRKFIKKYVKSCSCATAKTARHAPYGELCPLPIPERPWDHISIDFIGPLPPSMGFSMIAVWVDRFSKMAHFIPCSQHVTADDVAEMLIDSIFRLHGLPSSIVSDRGPQFVSRLWNKFCESMNIKVTLSTAYHPQTDGQTERVNQTLEQYIRTYSNYQQSNWAKLLPLAEFAYNNAPNVSTKASPFLANYGFHPKTDVLQFQNISDDTPDRTTSLIEQFTKLKDNIAMAQTTQKKYADQRRVPMEFAVGDSVYLSTADLNLQRPSKKLSQKRIGPYKILAKVGKVAYKLDIPRRLRIFDTFHVSKLEQYHADPFPSRAPLRPPPVMVDNAEIYEVDYLLDSRIHRRRLQYLVKWTGYPEADSTWEHLSNEDNCQDAIRQFHELYPSKPGGNGEGGVL